jgi:hypothetical protein
MLEIHLWNLGLDVGFTEISLLLSSAFSEQAPEYYTERDYEWSLPDSPYRIHIYFLDTVTFSGLCTFCIFVKNWPINGCMQLKL